MMRLLAILAARPMAFTSCLGSVRRSSPSISDEQFEVWSRAVYGEAGAWEMASGAVGAGETALAASLDHTGPGFALVGDVHARSASAARGAPCRNGRWVFAYDGAVEDLPFLLSRTSVRRACPGRSPAELLLAFLLTRLDELGLAESEATDAVDEVVRQAASEITRRIGSLSFLLCDGTTLYAYRFDRSLHLREREASERSPGVILIASESLTNEGWIALEDRSLVRCRRREPAQRGAESFDVAFLAGRDPRDVELPFTD